MEIVYNIGIPDIHRKKVVLLFDEAFGEKFSVAVKNKNLRLKLFEECFNLKYGISAICENNLVGIAGFSGENNSLTGNITYSHLIKNLGFIKGNWASLVLGLYDRKPEDKQLLMDGIAVDKVFRGRGIGKYLINTLINYAKNKNYSTIRLDVIDTNKRAKKLYENIGFVVVKKDYFPYLKWLIGFSASEELHYNLDLREIQ